MQVLQQSLQLYRQGLAVNEQQRAAV